MGGLRWNESESDPRSYREAHTRSKHSTRSDRHQIYTEQKRFTITCALPRQLLLGIPMFSCVTARTVARVFFRGKVLSLRFLSMRFLNIYFRSIYSLSISSNVPGNTRQRVIPTIYLTSRHVMPRHPGFYTEVIEKRDDKKGRGGLKADVLDRTVNLTQWCARVKSTAHALHIVKHLEQAKFVINLAENRGSPLSIIWLKPRTGAHLAEVKKM